MKAKGVFVTGMHRSGTSAMVLGLESLGLALCNDEDRLRAAQGNPDHGESMSVISENEAILASFEGSWASPKLASNWMNDHDLKRRQRTAEIQFRRSYPHEPWACKDPRFSLTLPYWDAVLGRKQPVVLLIRNPLEIVESLKRREPERRHTSSYYLSLWERYTRSALENCKGRPVYIANYDKLLTDWPSVKNDLRRWLNEVGIQTGLDNSSPVVQKHRHENAERSVEGLSVEQRRLYEELESITGAHIDFVLPDLGPETAHTKTLFGKRYIQREEGFSSLLATWPKTSIKVDWTAVRQYVTAGVIAAAVLSIISAATMYWSTSSVTESWNHAILTWMSNVKIPLVAGIMRIMSNLSASLTIDLIALVAAIVFVVWRKGLEALVLLLALAAENLVVLAFQSPTAMPVDDFAGRVFRMVVIFGLLGYLTYKSARSFAMRVEAMILFAALIALTCVSRIYEGARSPSSVLAAAFLGAAVLAVTISCYEAFNQSVHRSEAAG